MPTLNKPQKNYNPQRQRNDIDKRKRSEVYNSPIWRRLRLSKLMESPLCEVCQLMGLTALAEDIHHLVSFTQYVGTQRDAVAYDYDNLISLCRRHHWEIHNGWLKGATTLEEVQQRVKARKNEDKPL